MILGVGWGIGCMVSRGAISLGVAQSFRRGWRTAKER